MGGKTRLFAALLLALATVGSGVAFADIIPVDFGLTVVSGGEVYTYAITSVDGTMYGDGSFSGSGSIVETDFTIDWAIGGNLDPVVTLLGAVTAGASPTQFMFTSTLETFPVIFPNETGGSISGSLTDTNGDGATVSALPGEALYTAFLNGSTYQTLHDAPYSESIGPFGSDFVTPASFGNPIPSLPGPPATSMQIGVGFELSPLDQFSFTSNFVVEPPRTVIPEPATMTLLGLGLLGAVATRARRNRE